MIVDTANREYIPIPREQLEPLWQKGLETMQSLQTPLGLIASDKTGRFHAIFGRDSLWSVLLALEAGSLLRGKAPDEQQAHALTETYVAWLRPLAETVLRGLAHLQGKRVNDVNEEQPGRIIHEYWEVVPERLITSRFPLVEGRYYGSLDATFLYVITVAKVFAFFEERAFLEELWPSIEAALQWMLEWSDLDQDGLVEYSRRNPDGLGLLNQAWKDSTEAVWSKGLPVPAPPIAWIELQGYAWLAYLSYLQLAKQLGSLAPSMLQEIQYRVKRLSQGQRCFWLEDEQFPAIALDGHKRSIRAVSSNPGHLLWCGSVDQDEANKIHQRLMQPDMFTPWGLRTVSDRASFYNPLHYHSGSVWPFDNAVTVIGLCRYGFGTDAQRIAHAVLQALTAFGTPVEVYSVHPSRWIRSPHIMQEWVLADYFYASEMQAWTAAAMLYLTRLLMR